MKERGRRLKEANHPRSEFLLIRLEIRRRLFRPSRPQSVFGWFNPGWRASRLPWAFIFRAFGAKSTSVNLISKVGFRVPQAKRRVTVFRIDIRIFDGRAVQNPRISLSFAQFRLTLDINFTVGTGFDMSQSGELYSCAWSFWASSFKYHSSRAHRRSLNWLYSSPKIFLK